MPKPRATLTGEDSRFLCVAFSPDGELVAAGQQEGGLRIWQTASLAEWASMPGRASHLGDFRYTITSLSFSPDGRVLAWGGGEKVAYLWDVAGKRQLAALGPHEDKIECLAFTPDGRFVATATFGGVVRFWDVTTKQGRIVFEGKKSAYGRSGHWINAIAISPDGRTLVIGLFGDLVFLEVATEKVRCAAQGYKQQIQHLCFSPDGTMLAGQADGVKVWDPATAKELTAIPHKPVGPTASLAFSPDGKMLAIGMYIGVRQPSSVHIWDFERKQVVADFVCHKDAMTQLAWSPEGKTLATASGARVENTVKLWDVEKLLAPRK